MAEISPLPCPVFFLREYKNDGFGNPVRGKSLGAGARKTEHTPAAGNGPTDMGLASAGRGRRSRVFWDNSNPQILLQLHTLAGGIIYFKIRSKSSVLILSASSCPEGNLLPYLPLGGATL